MSRGTTKGLICILIYHQLQEGEQMWVRTYISGETHIPPLQGHPGPGDPTPTVRHGRGAWLRQGGGTAMALGGGVALAGWAWPEEGHVLLRTQWAILRGPSCLAPHNSWFLPAFCRTVLFSSTMPLSATIPLPKSLLFPTTLSFLHYFSYIYEQPP